MAEEQVRTKKWYQSLTIWFNLALLLVDFINQLAQIIPIPPGIISFVALVGNFLLRLKTTTGIRLTK